MVKFNFNPFIGTFDQVLNLENAMQFKGSISVSSDFPTSSEVKSGWFYTILADVTDNDASKTNTGQSFTTGDEIAWNGSDWTVLGNENQYYWTRTGTTLSPKNSGDDLIINGKVGVGRTPSMYNFEVEENAYIKGRLYLSEGTETYPSLTFADYPATGLFWDFYSGSFAFSYLGGKRMDINSTRVKLFEELEAEDITQDGHYDLTGQITQTNNYTDSGATIGHYLFHKTTDLGLTQNHFANQSSCDFEQSRDGIYIGGGFFNFRLNPSGQIGNSIGNIPTATGVIGQVSSKWDTYNMPTITTMAGVMSKWNFNSTGHPNVTNLAYFMGYDTTGTNMSGIVTNAYGLYLPSITYGTNNWAIKTGTGKIDFGDEMTMNLNKITNVADPTSNQDAATKKYVDNATPALDLQDVTDNGNTTTNSIIVGGSSSGQSIIDKGLVVNESGTGADATSDLRAETLNYANAFYVDASDDSVNIGVTLKTGASAKDLDVDCGTNKTIELQQKVYDDQQINMGEVAGGGWFGSTGVDIVEYRSGSALEFENSTTEGYKARFNAQISHKYAEGEDIEFHIHIGNNSSTSGPVVFKLTYEWANMDGTFPSATSTSKTFTIDGTDGKHQMEEIIASITGTSKEISSILLCTLERIADDAGDTFSESVYVIGIDFHVPLDTIGSRQEGTK